MKIKGRSKTNSIIFLMTFVLSCTSTPETALQQNIASTPTSYSLSTNTSIPTSPVVTLQPTPIVQIEDRCLSLEESLPLDFQLEGVWVRQESKPYLEINKENTKYRVPFEGGGWLYNYQGSWSVSPNGEWLAYIDTVLDTTGRAARKKGDLLKVIHASGYFLSLDYWPMTNQSIRGWVDDKNLLLKLDRRSIVLNPSSGKWYELKDPDWLTNPTINKHQWRVVEYSPHLDSVILRSDNQIELRETVSGNVLFKDDKFDLFDKFVWSPDAITLAITTNDGNAIHVFQNNKEILALDFLKNESLISNLGRGLSSIVKIEWSLNNQRLLIVPIRGNILLLDFGEQRLYKICFNNQEINNAEFWGGFFYSKTGQSIVVPVYIRDEHFDYEYFDVFIDTMTMRAYRLPTSKYNGRIGWLALPEPTEK